MVAALDVPEAPTLCRRAPLPWSSDNGATSSIRPASAAGDKSLRRIDLNLANSQRVNQLDSLRLDGSILGMLREQFVSTFEAFDNPVLLESLRPEIEFLIGSVLYLVTVARHKPTPGMRLQNIGPASYAFEFIKVLNQIPNFFRVSYQRLKPFLIMIFQNFRSEALTCSFRKNVCWSRVDCFRL